MTNTEKLTDEMIERAFDECKRLRDEPHARASARQKATKRAAYS